MKQINAQIQQFASTVKDEAGTIFGDANTVFQKITGALDHIVNGGPGQNGWSTTENNARTAATVQAGATEARNLKAIAASGAGAIGGGNVVAPAGLTQAMVMGAETKAASDTAAALNANAIANAEAGRDEFNKAISAEEAAPGVFNASIAANEGVTKAQTTAAQSQQEMDTESNWAMNDIMKLGSAAVTGLTSGMTGGMSGFGKLFSKGSAATADTGNIGDVSGDSSVG